MKTKKLLYMLLGGIVCIFTFSVMTINYKLNNRDITTTSASVLSNKNNQI